MPVVFSSHQLDLVERLCEAVAIIKDGRLVASGRVEELRDRGARDRRVRVAVEGDGDGAWLAGVPGAAVVARERAGLLVRLETGRIPTRCSTPRARPARCCTSASTGRP